MSDEADEGNKVDLCRGEGGLVLLLGVFFWGPYSKNMDNSATN